MIDITDKKDCCGCGACVQKCPKHCILMSEDEEGFLYPHADAGLCISCGLCEKVCPVLNQGNQNPPRLSLAAMNRNEKIRLQSSSGGVFTLLSDFIISKGGIVFGAAFDENWTVHHIAVSSKEGLSLLRGSKYLQSRIDGTYKEAEKELKAERSVLFTGTSCQIAGLKKFLRKDYDNLYTADCLCHGVPSPKVWKKYLEQVCDGKEVTTVKFRDKRTGWKNYSFTVSYKDSTEYSHPFSQDIFMKGFLSDLYLRPSCSCCPAKSGRCGSDFTLADYWGINKIQPNYDDDKGTGLLLVNSEKGEDLLGHLCLRCMPADLKQAVQYNGGFKEKVTFHPKRDLFFSHLEDTRNISQLIKKCIKPSLPHLVKSKVKRIIKKFI